MQKVDVKSVLTGEELTMTTEPRFFKKGEHIGEFRLGSTVVLVSRVHKSAVILSRPSYLQIFEGPPSISFTVAAGDQVQYGQSLILKDY